jgi:hypothetical protein
LTLVQIGFTVFPPQVKLILATDQQLPTPFSLAVQLLLVLTVSVYQQIQATAFVSPTAFAPVQLRSTSNQASLTGEVSMDGVTTSTSRVLLTAQTDASENGIYVTASGAWSRATDADADADFEFAKSVNVTAGTAGAGNSRRLVQPADCLRRYSLVSFRSSS